MVCQFEKISLTAKLVAYMRQFADIPFATEVVKYIATQETFEKLLDGTGMKLDDFLWYAPYFEARYKSIAILVQQLNSTQVLELASGISLRGLAMSLNSKLCYIESDLSGLTQEKSALLAQICQTHKIELPVNFQLAEVNATHLPQILTAIEKFDSKQAITIISEGLLQYLSPAELEQLIENVATVLRRHGGYFITPDFSIRSEQASIRPEQQKFRKLLAGATERSMYSNAFEDNQQLSEFLQRFNLRATEFNQHQLVPNLVSLTTLNLPQSIIFDQTKTLAKLWVCELATVPKA